MLNQGRITLVLMEQTHVGKGIFDDRQVFKTEKIKLDETR